MSSKRANTDRHNSGRSRERSSERQSKPYSSQYQDSSKDQPKSRANEEKTGEKPFVYRSKGERAYDKLAKKDQKYEEHKTKCCVGWDIAREKSRNSADELKNPAQMHQVKLERTADDERAKTEVMPWAKYFQDDKKESLGIIQAIISTADGRGKTLWAGFDSGLQIYHDNEPGQETRSGDPSLE